MGDIFELIEDLRDYGSVKGNIGILARLDEIQHKAEKMENILREKQSPKKIKEQSIKFNNHESVNYLCGACSWNLDMRDRFCKNCGQKLDWS